MLEDGRMRLVHGPKENHTRPAVDPLFRSAAIAYGPRVIGVVLSGYLDDGAAGLLAIKDRGGVAIIQDPAEAHAASMPESAAAVVKIDHTLVSTEIARVLVHYDPPPVALAPPLSPVIEMEHKMTAMQVLLTERRELERVAAPSAFTCPECGSALFQLKDARLLRFRCVQGHAWSVQTLLSTIAAAREESVWAAVARLTEEAELIKQLADTRKRGPETEQLLAQADRLAEQANRLRAFVSLSGDG
jgi:two-component system chemotaxis response regulator CheB